MDAKLFSARMRELDALLNAREDTERRLVAVKAELRGLTKDIDRLQKLLDIEIRARHDTPGVYTVSDLLRVASVACSS